MLAVRTRAQGRRARTGGPRSGKSQGRPAVRRVRGVPRITVAARGKATGSHVPAQKDTCLPGRNMSPRSLISDSVLGATAGTHRHRGHGPGYHRHIPGTERGRQAAGEPCQPRGRLPGRGSEGRRGPGRRPQRDPAHPGRRRDPLRPRDLRGSHVHVVRRSAASARGPRAWPPGWASAASSTRVSTRCPASPHHLAPTRSSPTCAGPEPAGSVRAGHDGGMRLVSLLPSATRSSTPSGSTSIWSG
jgi:hypothetical protein